MKIINNADLRTESDIDALSDDEIYWLYNGLDCCVTYEVHQVTKKKLDEETRGIYEHTLRMQAPILEMQLRGLRVDERARTKLRERLENEMALIRARLDILCIDGLGMEEGINPASPKQVGELFYRVLGIKERKHRTGSGNIALSTDRETLEGLRQHFNAEVFVNHILAYRDRAKSLGFLKTPTDSDGKMRCNFNLAGTNTGRLSSSFSDFGTGTNLQNVDKNLRDMFIADEGKIMVNIDLEQADSRNVGALCWQLFYDSHGPEFAGAYLDACESGDLHTQVCRMAWTHLEWGDDPKLWRSIADQVAYRTYSFRDMAKKLGHGTNYYGQPATMSGHSKVPQKEIEDFQRRYFAAFPCISEWHKWTIHQLQSTGQLTHLFGRKRTFFQRLTEQSTINAAIAYSPQGMTGEEINRGILNIFGQHGVELLVQVHDSILFQLPIESVNELLPMLLEMMEVHLQLKGGRDFFVPLEAQVGYNWGSRKLDKKTGKVTNPHGLTVFTGKEERTPPRRNLNKRVYLL